VKDIPSHNQSPTILAADKKKQETVVVALDLEDAYNKVRYDVLIMTLIDMEVCPWIINWISTRLYERQVALRMGGWVSDTHIVAPGLPQGSPILCNVYTASLTAIINVYTAVIQSK
jgi:hypothetical protein